MSNQAHKHADWMQAQKFFLRHFDFFVQWKTKICYKIGSWVLCDVDLVWSLWLFCPDFRDASNRVDAFLKEHAEALKKNSARNLDTALRSRHMLQFPMSTFTRLFLEKFEKQLASKNK